MVAPFIKQAWAVSAVLSNMVGQGMLLSYTTSLIPALQHPDSPIKADLYTASWLASACGFAGIPGFFVSSFLMDVYGRRLAHIVVILPGIAGWLMVYFAQNIPIIMTGRLLGGFTAGATVSLGAIAIGEYSEPKYRGVFLNLKTASVCLGGMVVHILSQYATWRNIALLALIPHVLSVFITMTWSESTAWLASRGRFDESKKSFFRLRGKDEASSKELEELIKAQMERLSKPKVEKSASDRINNFFKKLIRKDFVKPFFIVITSSTLMEASGRHVFQAYALQIIGEITGSKSQSFYFTLAIDLIITCSALFSSFLVKIMRRRTLLFSTGFSAFAVLMIVCTYLTLADNGIITKDYPWIPTGIFVVYFILANLGCTPIPLALLGEVFPLPHRGVGSAVAGIWMSLGVMIGLQITPYLLVNVKVYGTFFVFGMTMGLALLILFFILPETKDRTLQEIEDYFNFGKFRDDEKDEDEESKVKMIKQ
ncbi:facilitated trehalose transporter Tret1-like [Anticarsia gemmatalis]|uniref:facilitated trehalose transporter Tret1-like n=1 Tax=Anticarsia gemmatalis TaxID=129554 RepID=UPI003F7620C3